jgi:hypothetical protein
LSELKGQMTHPDPDVLAEFRAGLATGRRGARISAHLAACAHCTDVCGQLAEISVLLAAVPAPAMPDAVARRLEGVLAAEAAQRDDSERTVGDSSRDRVPGPPPRRHWDFRLVALRVLAPAAAVAVLAAGGYGLSRIAGSSTASEASGSAASSTASAASAAALPAARPEASALPSAGPASRSGAGPAIEAPLGFLVVTSRTDYLRATLGQQLAGEMHRYAQGDAGLRQPASASVKGCVLRVTRHTSPGTVKLVEKARFQGQPAIVIVAVSGHHDAAWVTTAGCSASSDRILATTTLPGT